MDWNRKFGIFTGDAISDVLSPFSERNFSLQKLHEDTCSRLRTGLSGLGTVFRGFEIVPLEKVCRGNAHLLEIRKLRVLKRFREDLVLSQKKCVASFLIDKLRGAFKEGIGDRYPQLVEAIEEDVGSFLQARLLREIERYVPEKMREDIREELRGLLWDSAWSNLRIFLYYHVGFLVSGKFREADRIDHFTRTFAAGNLPLGFVQDNLLVVVR